MHELHHSLVVSEFLRCLGVHFAHTLIMRTKCPGVVLQKPVEEWGREEVQKWLNVLGMQRYEEQFRAIQGRVWPTLTAQQTPNRQQLAVLMMQHSWSLHARLILSVDRITARRCSCMHLDSSAASWGWKH